MHRCDGFRPKARGEGLMVEDGFGLARRPVPGKSVPERTTGGRVRRAGVVGASIALAVSLLGVGAAQGAGIQNRAVKIGTFSFQSVGSGPEEGGGAEGGPPHEPKNQTLRHT